MVPASPRDYRGTEREGEAEIKQSALGERKWVEHIERRAPCPRHTVRWPRQAGSTLKESVADLDNFPLDHLADWGQGRNKASGAVSLHFLCVDKC